MGVRSWLGGLARRPTRYGGGDGIPRPGLLARAREALRPRRSTSARGATARSRTWRLVVVVVVVALAVQSAAALFLLLEEREALAARRLNDIALPLATQFRDLLPTGIAPDEALDRLRQQAVALRLEMAILSPSGRVLRDTSGGLLEGAETGLSTEQLSASLEAPHMGILRAPGGHEYRFVAFSTASLRRPANRPELGGLAVAERADRTPLSFRSLAFPLAQGGMAALLTAVVLAYVLVRRASRPLEEAAAEATRLARGGGRAVAPIGGAAEIQVVVEQLNVLGDELAHTRRGAQGFVMALGQGLREPLGNVRAGLREVAKAADAPAEERQVALQLLEHELRRIQQLVAQLLALARLQTHQVDMAYEVVDLVDLAANLVAAVGPAARERGAEVVFDVDPQAVTVLGDANRLEQAIHALIHHAIQETGEGAVVTVGVGVFVPDDPGGFGGVEIAPDARHSLHAWLSVHYPGDSALDGDPQQLFDPVGGGAENGAVGDRLGLAIAREIVLAHGGQVLVEGDAVSGARLALMLPASSDAAAGPDERPDNGAETESADL